MGLQACAGSRPELALRLSALLAVGQEWQLGLPWLLYLLRLWYSCETFVLSANNVSPLADATSAQSYGRDWKASKGKQCR